MTALDVLVPVPRILEVDHVDLAAEPARVWELVRHANLARSPLIRALFTIRGLPARIAGAPPEPAEIVLDTLRSTPEQPGFQILHDEPPREVAVGAIGRVWEPSIPFVHVPDAAAFAAFDEPDYAKVAWAIRVEPRGERDCRVSVEVRVATTDEASWASLRRYFRLIAPGSHFIRRSALAQLVRELGTPEAREGERALAGDELLPDAAAQLTDGITIAAPPEAIWPWLVQMGGRRGGYYAIDALDGDGPSAREVHPDLQALTVGDVIPATAEGDDGFEVLRIEEGRSLVLGGLFDSDQGRQIPFDSARPDRYWHVTWAFVLEPLSPRETRLHVRARAAFSPDQRLHVAWIRPVHRLMERRQLEHLAARAEGRLPRDSIRDVLSGIGGAAAMVAALLTSFLRGPRSHWGLTAEEAAAARPGDDLVKDPRWGWTHAVAIDAPAERVWPFVAQIGADRGGFYSYQWLENLAGCEVTNAEAVHAEWSIQTGDTFYLHPNMPPLRVAACEPGRWFVVHGPADAEARAAGEPWVEVSWLFSVEPLGADRCRFVSRYRCATSDDLATRASFGPALVEPVGFVMDRRMLLGVKERAEKRLAEMKNVNA